MRRRICNEGILSVVVCLPLLRRCRPAAMAGESAPGCAIETVQARVVESRQQQAPVHVRTTGTVHARESAIVSAQVVGRIQQVLVREGDNVRAEQTLACSTTPRCALRCDQAQAGVKAAQSQQAAAQTDANLAASTLERYRQLQAQKSVSPQEMDEVAQRARQPPPGLKQCVLSNRGGKGAGKRRAHDAGLHTSGSALCRRRDGADGRSGNAGLPGHAAASAGSGRAAAIASHGG